MNSVISQASDGLYYQASERDGEVVFAVVAPPDSHQRADIVLRGTTSGIQMTAATATSQARLNFTLLEQYTKYSGASAARRHKVTMWGNQAVLAHAEMQEGDRITVLGSFSPNSYTDQHEIYQQTYNVTARVLDSYGQKQTAKATPPQAEQQAAPVAPALPVAKARAAKTSPVLATA